VFVTSIAQSLVNGGPHNAVQIRPDMDNTFVANDISLSGLHDAQRYTMAMHWIGAGANLFEGGDLTQIDALGRKLLSDPAMHGAGGIAAQFSDHPMQPRNPHALSCQTHWPFVAGAGNPQQLQAWIAGPNAAGDALVIVSNLGPDKHPHDPRKGTFRTKCNGSHTLSISFAELGLADEVQYEVSVVWDGRAVALAPSGANGLDGAGDTMAGEVSAELGPWESVMFKLARATGAAPTPVPPAALLPPLRAPATPLWVHSPYVNWLMPADNATGAWVSHVRNDKLVDDGGRPRRRHGLQHPRPAW
jgi:hypothetical protein